MVVVVGMTGFFIAMLCGFAWLFANEEQGLQCAKWFSSVAIKKYCS
jgi:hypothetical protein